MSYLWKFPTHVCFTQASFGWDDGGEDWYDNDHGDDGDDAGDPQFVRKLMMVMVKLSLKDDSCL